MDNIDFIENLALDVVDNSIIKVIGVGGGGCNAVNYMYKQGIQDVSFLVCNTDSMALEKMSVPAKLQLGQGLGAGGRPEVAEQFAQESKERIKEALNDGTKMVFITAGMGGGTGTGASPVVASIAREMGLLTVGIVTIPFSFEGKRAIRKAMEGVAKLAQHTDALLIINNERLKLLFPEFDLPNAFSKSDEVVSNAAKSIAEIITITGYINTDFQDVYNTLKDGNVAIMNVGRASGEKRITKAIEDALNSPLVNTTDIRGAHRILLNFYCSREHAVLMQELEEVEAFYDIVGDNVEIKWGIAYDEELGEEVKVTLIATGYSVVDIPGLEDACPSDTNSYTPLKTEGYTKSIEDSMNAFYGNLSDKENQPAKQEQEEQETEKDTTEETPESNTIVWDANTDFIDIENLSDEQQQQVEDIPAWMRRR